MSIKKELTKVFGQKEKMIEYRYISSRNLFAYTSLAFFINYFFV